MYGYSATIGYTENEDIYKSIKRAHFTLLSKAKPNGPIRNRTEYENESPIFFTNVAIPKGWFSLTPVSIVFMKYTTLLIQYKEFIQGQTIKGEK